MGCHAGSGSNPASLRSGEACSIHLVDFFIWGSGFPIMTVSMDDNLLNSLAVIGEGSLISGRGSKAVGSGALICSSGA